MQKSKRKNQNFGPKRTAKQFLVKTVKPIKNWRDLLQFYEKDWPKLRGKRKWVFRGDNPVPQPQEDVFKEKFKSRLDKAFDVFGTQESDTKSDTEKRWHIETELIREFRRKSPLFRLRGKPEDQLECLALMQHYEAPTRMLDWTYSFFAAVYFAINRAKCGSCVVWALDSDWLSEVNKCLEIDFKKSLTTKKEREDVERLRKDWSNKFQNKVMLYLRKLQNPEDPKKPKRLVYQVSPYYLNERLSIQQGVLLFPGDIGAS